MNKAESHYLNCQDENCEKAYCVGRRDYESKIRRAESERDAYIETLTRISKLEKAVSIEWAIRVSQSILGFYKE